MKNKFLYFVILGIVVIIGIAVYIAIFQKGIDRNSYVELLEGTATLNGENLEINNRKQLSGQDVVETTSQDALAVIEWGDGSVTRLGGNTRVQVNEFFVSKKADKLRISFELFSGKTWSNIVSLIPDDSYFKQSFVDMEAAVRGTVFDVDLESEYLYVLENSVDLFKKSGQKIATIKEGEGFSFKTFIIDKLKKLDDFMKKNIQKDLEMFVENVKIGLEKVKNYIISLINVFKQLSDDESKQFISSTIKSFLEKLEGDVATYISSYIYLPLKELSDTLTGNAKRDLENVMKVVSDNANNITKNIPEEYISALWKAIVENWNKLKAIFGF